MEYKQSLSKALNKLAAFETLLPALEGMPATTRLAEKLVRGPIKQQIRDTSNQNPSTAPEREVDNSVPTDPQTVAGNLGQDTSWNRLTVSPSIKEQETYPK